MKALILANQDGSGLMPLTARRPVCLLQFGEKCLLDMAIEMSLSAKASGIVILDSGRHHDSVSAYVRDAYPGAGMITVADSGPSAEGTPGVLRDLLEGGDVLIVHADALCMHPPVEDMLGCGADIVFATAPEHDGAPLLAFSRSGALARALGDNSLPAALGSLRPASPDLSGRPDISVREFRISTPCAKITDLDGLRSAEEDVFPCMDDTARGDASRSADEQAFPKAGKLTGYAVTALILMRLGPGQAEAVAAVSGICSALLFMAGHWSTAAAGMILLGLFFFCARAGRLLKDPRQRRRPWVLSSPLPAAAAALNLAAMSFCLYREVNAASTAWAACWLLMLLVK